MSKPPSASTAAISSAERVFSASFLSQSSGMSRTRSSGAPETASNPLKQAAKTRSKRSNQRSSFTRAERARK